MNIMIQRHSADCIYVIPDGLKELMADISREVLRMQPENLYVFIADYLEALLLTRENARVAARIVQSITEIAEATMDFLQNTGMERDQVDKVVKIIHEKFRKKIREERLSSPSEQQTDDVDEANLISDILNESDIHPNLAEESAKIIQNAYRKLKHRKEAEKHLLTGMIDWRIAARSAIRLYRQTGVTNEEANRAATLIKAAYRGYYTRRIMKTLTEEQKILHPQSVHEPGLKGMSPDKYVKIDYDSVIPHVDFGDVTDLESPIAIVRFVIERMLDGVAHEVIPEEVEEEEPPATPAAPPQPGIEPTPSMYSRQSMSKKVSIMGRGQSVVSEESEISSKAERKMPSISSRHSARSQQSSKSEGASSAISGEEATTMSRTSERSVKSYLSQSCGHPGHLSTKSSNRSSKYSEVSEVERKSLVSKRSSKGSKTSRATSRTTSTGGTSAVSEESDKVRGGLV